MSYLIKLIKSLPVLLMVLVLHALVLWQVIKHKPDRNVKQQPKTLMVHIITPAPIIKKPPLPKTIIKPIIKKRVNVAVEGTKRVASQRLAAQILAAQKRAKLLSAARLAAQKRAKRLAAKRLAAQKRAAERLAAKKLAAKRLAEKRAKRLAVQRLAAQKRTERLAAKRLAAQKLAAERRLAAEKRAAKRRLAAKRLANQKRAEKLAAERRLAARAKKRQSASMGTSQKASLLYSPSSNSYYPRLSRRRGEQGTVLLRVQVNPNGRAVAIQIKKSSGSKRLDNAARKIVRNSRFSPAKKNGIAVSNRIIVPIVFKLN